MQSCPTNSLSRLSEPSGIIAQVTNYGSFVLKRLRGGGAFLTSGVPLGLGQLPSLATALTQWRQSWGHKKFVLFSSSPFGLNWVGGRFPCLRNITLLEQLPSLATAPAQRSKTGHDWGTIGKRRAFEMDIDGGWGGRHCQSGLKKIETILFSSRKLVHKWTMGPTDVANESWSKWN